MDGDEGPPTCHLFKKLSSSPCLLDDTYGCHRNLTGWMHRAAPKSSARMGGWSSAATGRIAGCTQSAAAPRGISSVYVGCELDLTQAAAIRAWRLIRANLGGQCASAAGVTEYGQNYLLHAPLNGASTPATRSSRCVRLEWSLRPSLAHYTHPGHRTQEFTQPECREPREVMGIVYPLSSIVSSSRTLSIHYSLYICVREFDRFIYLFIYVYVIGARVLAYAHSLSRAPGKSSTSNRQPPVCSHSTQEESTREHRTCTL